MLESAMTFAYVAAAVTALLALSCLARNLVVPSVVVGVILVAFLMRGALEGMSVNLGTKNATMEVNVDAAEYQAIKAKVDDLESKLFGEGGESAGRNLQSLASLLRDTQAVEGKILEAKSLLQAFSNNSEAVDAFLDRQAQKMDSLVRSGVRHALDLTTEEGFWARLKPRLAEAGLLNDIAPELLIKVETEKARAQEELRIKSGIEEKVEEIRAKGWRNLARGISEDFNEHLPFRAMVLVLIIASFFALRLLYQMVLRRLKIPPLIDETSFSSWSSWRPFRRPLDGDVSARIFKAHTPEIVLAPDVQESVSGMAVAALWAAGLHEGAKRLRRAGLALPNAVFYGPPGTGKSLTARRLATACGLDYAIMSGGNVIGLREEAVPELRRIFQWARRAPRGLVLFVDEAEAFLAARGGDGANPFVQAAVSFFLAQTTTSSTRLLIILATNRVQDLDEAVLSRMAFTIEFGRPDRAMVDRLVADRINSLGSEEARSCIDKVLTEFFKESDEHLDSLGFAGRDIQQLFEEFDRRWSLQLATEGSPDPKRANIEWLRRWLKHRGIGGGVGGSHGAGVVARERLDGCAAAFPSPGAEHRDGCGSSGRANSGSGGGSGNGAGVSEGAGGAAADDGSAASAA